MTPDSTAHSAPQVPQLIFRGQGLCGRGREGTGGIRRGKEGIKEGKGRE